MHAKNELASYERFYNFSRRMFYFFFESRGKKQDDPVVIWLTGGPGCSSELAFYENGLFTIANNMSLAWNKFGWDTVSDYFNHNLAMLPWRRTTLLQALNFDVYCMWRLL
jgi:hypothetical protein